MRFPLVLALPLLLAPGVLLAQDTTSRRGTQRRPVRRIPVTAEHLRTAFSDDRARELFERARAARVTQDSALQAYDARSWLRLSVGVGVRRPGRERLFFRTEQSARVRWSREGGAWVEPTGRRTAFPMGKADVDMSPATPIPYYPGKETLWLPGDVMGVASQRVEVDENELLHPLATGAEAYYRYATGDSASIRLPDGRVVSLRELRVTARTPSYRAFVGSFWFDAERGSLVRAAYRLAAEIDFWALASDEQKQELEAAIERARTDSSLRARKAVDSVLRANRADANGRRAGRAILGDMGARITAITVEYGLHEGRFWLPRAHVGEGEIDLRFLRVPITVAESFRYESVNVGDPVPAATVALAGGLTEEDTLFAGTGGTATINVGDDTRRRAADTTAATRRAREDSLVRRYTRLVDSLRARADSFQAAGDTAQARDLRIGADWWNARVRTMARRREACERGDSTYLAGRIARFEGAVRTVVRLPCNPAVLADSPDLPGSIYDDGEALFDEAQRDELLEALDFGLQAPWSPRRPTLRTGLDLLRYNRVEGLSLGVRGTSLLGAGYTATGELRLGVGDRVPNGELSLARSTGRRQVALTAFHRLGVANDDWGAPLAVGASLANLLYARDEGFYYRTVGVELTGLRDAPGPLGGATVRWRLFAERHRSAGVEPNTQLSLGNAIGSARFQQNIDAVGTSALGAAADLVRSFGADPQRLRLDARLRGEGAMTGREDSLATTGYGRVSLDATVARPVGRFSIGLTGAAGTSAGDLPIQRAFFVGGVQTVRGQFARVDSVGDAGRVGDAFWLGRAELGLGRMLAARPSLFSDVGWAGARTEWGRGTPLSGAGLGLSLLDGIVRLDLARGIRPEKRWRFDVYVDARF